MDDIENINNKFEQIQENQNTSDAAPGLNTNHELESDKLERENKEREQKAKTLIDNMQNDLKLYIDSQMAQIPNLINTSIQQAMNQIIPQLQQAGNQQAAQHQGGAADADKMAALGQLAPVIAQIFGKGGEPQGNNPQNMIMDMIIQSYMKRMQMDIDAQFMNTYQQPVNPPQWQNQNPNPPNQSNLNIE